MLALQSSARQLVRSCPLEVMVQVTTASVLAQLLAPVSALLRRELRRRAIRGFLLQCRLEPGPPALRSYGRNQSRQGSGDRPAGTLNCRKAKLHSENPETDLDTGSHDRMDPKILLLDIVPARMRHMQHTSRYLSRRIRLAYAAANSDSS